MNTKQSTKELNRFYDIVTEDAINIQDWIDTDTQPDEGSYESCFFDDGYFDIITWINSECLDANSHELLLATGGPAYGVVIVQDHPYFWYQDWFIPKTFRALDGDAVTFYENVFQLIKELDN